MPAFYGRCCCWYNYAFTTLRKPVSNGLKTQQRNRPDRRPVLWVSVAMSVENKKRKEKDPVITRNVQAVRADFYEWEKRMSHN